MNRRTQLLADPKAIFVHDAVLRSCEKFGGKIALVDTSTPDAPLRISFADYGDRVQRLARGLVAAGIRPGDIIAIFLPNCWEFAAAYHATTLAGATPTPLNPAYREREVRYQLENSGARMLITDGPLISGMDLAGLSDLRCVYTTRTDSPSATPFVELLRPHAAVLLRPDRDSREVIAALPYSSGTTGLPKGVMLSHFNLMSNVYQTFGPGALPSDSDQTFLCFLPFYHIYGLNVLLNPSLILGITQVLMPRFNLDAALKLIAEEGITTAPSVPPVINAFCHAAENGRFPRNHRLHWIKSGAAPLAPELSRRLTELTGIRVVQGYGMTEASPVTHVGNPEPDSAHLDSIGQPLAHTECRVVAFEGGNERQAALGEPGELVMRGPQFMLGYWKSPAATGDVMRDGWYWSGDVATRDAEDFYRIVDRRKEMIKYKGFPVAPAEVEALLLEHPAVRDCGVVGRPDRDAGEVPCAFIVLRDSLADSQRTCAEIRSFLEERVAAYKVPKEIRFVQEIPRNPSGKILRKDLRASL